jgi:hypothetical protein
MEGYSDWEYYSDDYYDDDPSLLKNNPQEGSPLPKNNTQEGGSLHRNKPKRPNGLHRGKKRKLAATRDIPDLSLNEDGEQDLRDSGSRFKGVIWRSPPGEEKAPQLYEAGIGERVALLDNWREVFKASQPFGQKRRTGPVTARKPVGNSRDASVRASPVETSLVEGAEPDELGEAAHLDEDEIATARKPKRRRVSFATSPVSAPKQPVVVEIPVHRANGVTKKGAEGTKETTQKRPPGRKRKASEVENESVNEAISKPAAKRVASGRTSEKRTGKANPPTAPTARMTRSKKK